jgi:hypothetical protein
MVMWLVVAEWIGFEIKTFFQRPRVCVCVCVCLCLFVRDRVDSIKRRRRKLIPINSFSGLTPAVYGR